MSTHNDDDDGSEIVLLNFTLRSNGCHRHLPFLASEGEGIGCGSREWQWVALQDVCVCAAKNRFSQCDKISTAASVLTAFRPSAPSNPFKPARACRTNCICTIYKEKGSSAHPTRKTTRVAATAARIHHVAHRWSVGSAHNADVDADVAASDATLRLGGG